MAVREIEIGTTPKRVLVRNERRLLYAVINESSVDVYLGFSSTLATSGESKGIKISANGGYYIDPAHKGEVWLIAPSATKVTLIELPVPEHVEKPPVGSPVYGIPPTATAKMQAYDGTNWVNVASTSDGELKIYLPKFEHDFGSFTATGASDSVDTVIGFEKWTWQQINDASSTAPDIRLQGSIDGINWFDLDTSTAIGSEMKHVVNKAVRYVRINVVSMGDASSINVRIFAIR